MPSQIVFSDKKTLNVDQEPSELAQALSKHAGKAQFAGDYLYVRAEEGDVWVNPVAVAYLKRI